MSVCQRCGGPVADGQNLCATCRLIDTCRTSTPISSAVAMPRVQAIKQPVRAGMIERGFEKKGATGSSGGLAGINLYGECPACGESFSLSDAALFQNEPSTALALSALDNWKQSLAAAMDQMDKRKTQAGERAKRGVLGANVGKVLEKIAPALPGFSFDCHDCRFLSEPIDYVVFEGLAKTGRVNAIQIVDIKTGQARLNEHQKWIKTAVEEGRVEWQTYAKV